AALRLHHQRAGVVLAGDQLDVVLLAAGLVCDGLGQFGVVGRNTGITRVHRRLQQAGRGKGPPIVSPPPPRRPPGGPRVARQPRKRSRPPEGGRPGVAWARTGLAQWCRIRSAMTPVAMATRSMLPRSSRTQWWPCGGRRRW